ncbi:MAG: diguanylate cyclase [Pseudomonadota bacterium]
MNKDPKLTTGLHIIEHLFEGAYLVDDVQRIIGWNEAAERITGFSADQVLGRTCANSLLIHVDDSGNCLCSCESCPFAIARDAGASPVQRVYLRHKDGYRVPVRVRTVRLQGEGGVPGNILQLFVEDESAEATRSALAEMREVALVDVLTGLPNRRQMEQILNARLSELARDGYSFGVLFIDVDDFKALNDAFGHDVGDEALRMVSRTISNSLRRHDTVARWGGEEFVAVLANLHEGALSRVAQKVRMLVAQSELSSARGPLRLTVSVGGTMARAEDDVDSLLRRADTLMYQSKRQGKNRITLDEAVAVSP